MLAECLQTGLSVIPYYPLASGLLTGKYRAGRPAPEGSRLQARLGEGLVTNQRLRFVEALLAYAESKGHTLLELAMSWLASRPAVASVIAGATSPDQVRDNAVSARWQLTDAEIVEVDALLTRISAEAAA